jgi:CysZ protein
MVWVALATLVLTLPFALCVPIVGPPLAAAISAWVVGLEYLDCALARKRYTLTQKISFIWANKARSMGLGLAAYGLLLVPLVNLLVIPLVAAGATRVFLDCETKSANDDRR